MVDILLRNFVTIALLLGFALLIRIGDVFERKIERLLKLATVLLSVLVIADMLDYYFELQDTLNNLRYLTSALGYTLRIAGLGIFITILLRKNDNILHIWIPVIIIGIISITSYWTHVMFYFTDDNQFVRGPLGLIAHFTSFAYLILLLYYAIKRFKSIDISELLTIFFIVITISTAIIIETVFQIKFLVSGAAVSSCIIYYTYLYVQVYKTDPLTDVFNRTSFNKDIFKKSNKNISIINVDLDNLKYINDTRGHKAGDKALITLAKVLTTVSSNKYRVYRVGGDEFYVIGVNIPTYALKTFIKKSKKYLERYRLTASFGYAQYKPGDDFGDCCTEADKMMYEDKKNKPIHN